MAEEEEAGSPGEHEKYGGLEQGLRLFTRVAIVIPPMWKHKATWEVDMSWMKKYKQ